MTKADEEKLKMTKRKILQSIPENLYRVRRN